MTTTTKVGIFLLSFVFIGAHTAFTVAMVHNQHVLSAENDQIQVRLAASEARIQILEKKQAQTAFQVSTISKTYIPSIVKHFNWLYTQVQGLILVPEKPQETPKNCSDPDDQPLDCPAEPQKL